MRNSARISLLALTLAGASMGGIVALDAVGERNQIMSYLLYQEIKRLEDNFDENKRFIEMCGEDYTPMKGYLINEGNVILREILNKESSPEGVDLMEGERNWKIEFGLGALGLITSVYGIFLLTREHKKYS
jgi:hypothetical protein